MKDAMFSSNFKILKIILAGCTFFGLMFFSLPFGKKGCSHTKKALNLTELERGQLRYLLEDLLFENYGVYVLFGSKPMAVMSLLDTQKADEEDEKSWALLSEQEKKIYKEKIEELRASGELIEKLQYNPYECWKTLERVCLQLNIKRYVFGARPVNQSAECFELYIADIQKTAAVILENYAIFKEIVKADFHPLEVVFELDDCQSHFWDAVFNNHLAKGLLFGFDKKNAYFFSWEMEYAGHNPKVIHYLRDVSLSVSTKKSIPPGRSNATNFTIPLFGCVRGDKCARRYKKERKKILKMYRGKDMVDVTLQRLCK